ncbi:MAG: 60S ribosomal export protein NMD3 [Nanoarchaeota archaeon]|nr:60S ribosomal export protein NMD3 [Nanoarchaeota archaeon]
MTTENPKHSQYYEAIIQLRPVTDELMRFISNRVKERPKVFISKIKKLPTGVDIYISSQSYARAIGKKLKRSFKGDLKITRTLHTMDRMSGKQIYRGTILFRLKPKEEPTETFE